ncbi:hypothetical protein [Halorientalis litorea]|uniref:hypothetical protein n=1 Tax=Halorientalis litorea TaxID=2931977 RepID=UPI001FF1343E|nr:hypothetical protein [Halorientalis litorea]
MVQSTLLASTLLMGLLLAATVVAVRSFGPRRTHAVPATNEGAATLRRVAGSPVAWTVTFLALSAVGVAGVLLFVTGGSLLPSVPGLGLWLVGVLAGVVLLYLVWGVYHAVRYRGLHRPAALAAAAWMVGMLVVAVVSLRLRDVL